MTQERIAEYEAEIAALKAEVERLSTPDFYYDAAWGDPWHDTIKGSLEDITAYCKPGEIVCIRSIKHFPDKFAAIYLDNTKMKSTELCATYEEAEAFVKSLKVAG